MSHPIPQPPAFPFIGNLHQVDNEVPIRGYFLLSKQYGEIYKMNILGLHVSHPKYSANDWLVWLGREMIIITSQALCNEVSDDKRFHKQPNAVLEQVRNIIGDGLFTGYNHEPNWILARKCFFIALRMLINA